MGTGIRVRIVVRISNTTWKMENYVRLWSLAQQIRKQRLTGLYGLVNGGKTDGFTAMRFFLSRKLAQ